MNPIYRICNSLPSQGVKGCKVRVVGAVRGEEGGVREGGGDEKLRGVEYQYEHGAPSYPADVLEDSGRIMMVVGEEGVVDVKVVGMVDDSASITVEGVDTVESDGSGAGVPIEGEMRDVPVGPYEVHATHSNIDYPTPEGNISYISCTVGAGVGEEVEIEVEEDEEPPIDCECVEEEEEEGEEGCEECEEAEECEEEPPTEAGGVPKEVDMRGGVGEQGMSEMASTSGGSAVRRVAYAERMGWSAQFGVFRGQAQMQPGRLAVGSRTGYREELGTPAGLEWQHPLGSTLNYPSEGLAPGALVMLRVGGGKLHAMLNGKGNRFFLVGASRKSAVVMEVVSEMSISPMAVSDLEHAAYVRVSFANGAANFYSVQSGQCVGYMTQSGLVVQAREVERYMAIVRDEQGVIRQVWNMWDGLADVVRQGERSYEIRIYPPAQVSARGEDGLFGVQGEAVRVFRISADDAAKSVSVAERDATLPRSADEMVSTWSYEGGVWSYAEGTGAEAVHTQRQRSDENEAGYSVITRKVKGGKVASCVRIDYRRTAAGRQMLRKVEGYGEAGASWTNYRYNNSNRLIGKEQSNGAVYRMVYDAAGRLIIEQSPWGKEGVRTVQTSYPGGAFGSRPAKVQTLYALPSKQATLTTERYSYSSDGQVERVEKRTTGAGSTQEQVTVSERWLAGAPHAYAAGRVRMTQAANGVQRWYEYAEAAAYGALYMVREETRVGGELVAGQSTRQVSYISAEGNTLREESYVLLASGEWARTAGATHSYNVLNRLVRTVYDNGRSTSRALTCQGKPLREVDENGVVTTYAYDSARQLIETIRSATPTTPETVTAYTRDAAGRATVTEECIGAMKRVTRMAYDLQGRVVMSMDALGRVTRTAYSDNGLERTTTTPSGATLINVYNPDGSLAHAAGTGQRELHYKYDFVDGLRRTTYLADEQTILARQITDGFGQLIIQTAPTTLQNTWLYTRSAYNAKGQLTQKQVGDEAPVAYAYDSMGNLVQQTQLLDASSPEDATKNVIVKQTQRYEKLEGGVYQVVSGERNNAAGEWLTSVQKTLVSKLSSTLESKQISVDERGNASTMWTEYGEGTQRKSYSQIPTSTITAETITIDGFTTSRTDHVGITTTATRRYLEKGVEMKSTDGRGNTTTTLTDIAERVVEVVDAAGDATRTAYDPASNNPALITDALGYTTCYAYDVRGRKVAEYGTGVQPAAYEYDDADRLTGLTTWRMGQQTIVTDPRDLTGGDTTTWTYDDATGLETGITYANGQGATKSYDAANRLASETSARGIITAYRYDEKTGWLTALSFSTPGATRQLFTYNLLGQPTQITDAAGTRTLSYDKFGNLMDEKLGEGESQVTRYELTDAYGRSIGYSLSREAELLQLVSTGYADNGRINKASFMDAEGGEQKFTYAYLPGSNLLQTLTQPNGVLLTQSYAEKQDLLTGIAYSKDGVEVARRAYTYDALARPTERQSAQQGREPITDHFGYNPRSELTSAQVSGELYGYDYDNIGNRRLAFGGADYAVYTANELNQYTQIEANGSDFIPEYDADGNQTLIMTATGIWHVEYNAQNRAVRFASANGSTIITCAYDYMGRRFEKKVEQNGETTLHERYIYRNYLQIAALDLLTNTTKHAILWDPTQATATRPLAIQKDGTWFTYGWDLTKNIIALFAPTGALATTYTYTPYGSVTAQGDVDQSSRGSGGGLDTSQEVPGGRTANGVAVSQPIQWSSEYHDTELGLVYYNYRYYNPVDGRWMRRDPIGIYDTNNLYSYVGNNVVIGYDERGLNCAKCEDYIAQKMQTYAITIARIRRKCQLDIGCEVIHSRDPRSIILGYTTRLDNRWNPFTSIHIKIAINCCIGATQSQDSPEDTFGHELVHAEDFCYGDDPDNSCKASVCSELRSYTIGGCKGLTGKNLRSCLEHRVPGSSIVFCKSKSEILRLIDENYEECLRGYPH